MSKIELKHLTVQFNQKHRQTTAVDDVSLSINQGEIYGIVGLSGAGKSTLVRTMNLLQKPTSGQVFFDGQDVTNFKGVNLSHFRKKTGMIFQHFNLIQNKTIGQNVLFALEAGDYPKAKRQERVEQLLSLVDLGDKINDYPRRLSGGQKQRVGIARALANEPEVLLCDEATSALDVETTEEIVRLLEKINLELGLTIVFITHQMEVAKRLFHRIAVMDQGKIVEENDTFSIFAQPQHSFTQKIVGRHMNLILPQELFNQYESGKLVELTYLGEQTMAPLISLISREYPVLISIIHAKIEYIHGKVIGRLIIHIDGEQHAIDKAVQHLKSKVNQLRLVERQGG